MEIDYLNHPFYRRFRILFKDFKETFISEDVQADIDSLPDCNYLDSLERWLEIYEEAYMNFTQGLDEHDKNYRESYVVLVQCYGEGVIYPTKRKIEYIKEVIKKALPPQNETKNSRQNNTGVMINKEPLTPQKISTILHELRQKPIYVKELTEYQFVCIIEALEKEITGNLGIVVGVEMIESNSPENIKIVNKVLFEDKRNFIDKLRSIRNGENENNFPPQQTETKSDKLNAELGKYGFFELSKVNQLSELNKQSLIELISKNGLPYSIAMFHFLGFLKHIENEHFKTKYELNKEVAKWFNSDKDGRAVKGNISSLSDYSKENKSKYTAHTHKETVIIDYQKFK